ncbi:Hypothetical protein FKW44_011358, partial [Caligus rogercresseyi]
VKKLTNCNSKFYSKDDSNAHHSKFVRLQALWTRYNHSSKFSEEVKAKFGDKAALVT